MTKVIVQSLFRGAAILTSLFAVTAVMAQDNATDDEEIDEIIVVSPATRLTSGFESAKPVTTVDRSDLDARGVINIADYMMELPSIVGSESRASTTLSGAAASGTNSINLRNLGLNRTLVMVDKKRWVPSSTVGFVDLNTIPQLLIEQVEIVTGGVSAQWGSDAVAGVVNLRTDRRLEGGKVQASYGETDYGDDQQTSFGAAYGFTFADDRAHLSAGVEYTDSEGIRSHQDRDWGRQLWGIIGNPADAGPNDGIPARLVSPNVRFGLGTPGGYLPVAFGNHPAVAGTYFGPNGEPLPYDYGQYPLPAGFAVLPFQVGGSGGSLAWDSRVSTPLERTTAMALLDYDVTDDVSFFLDLAYAETSTSNEISQPFNLLGAGPDVIFGDNPFIPAALQQIMTDNGVPVLIVARTNEDHGYITENRDLETTRIATGLNGAFNDWNWDVYVSYGKSEAKGAGANNVITMNRVMALDAVTDPGTGQPICGANLGGANGAPGCAPLNIFGNGSPSQEALDYIHGSARSIDTNRQTVVSASMSGEIAEMPAGPLAIAFGAEYRKEEASTDLDDIANSGGYFLRNGDDLSGDYNVKEAFVELGVPLIDNGSGVTLDMNAAVRYATYDPSGSTVPWQVGFSFSPAQSVSLRGTVSNDIRAPNVLELFSSENQQFNNVTNPDTGEVTFATIRTGGNPNLKEEEAETTTFGVVYQPTWADGFAASLDWYKTDLTNAIGVLPAQSIVDNCVLLNVGCENVEYQGQSITGVRATFINIAERTVEGIDAEFQYATDNFATGGLSLRLLLSHYMENSFSPDSVTTFDDAGVVSGNSAGGVPTPEWRGNFSADYTKGDFGLLTQIIHIGGGDLFNDAGPEDINDNSVDSQTLVNLGFRYNLPFADEGNAQLFAGVDNVFDEDPPVAPAGFIVNLGTNFQLYNPSGRRYYAGVRVRF